MNSIILQNLQRLLESQQATHIHIYGHDKHKIGHAAIQRLQTEHKIARPFGASMVPLTLTLRDKVRMMYPVNVIQRKCIVGRAVNKKGQPLLIVYLGPEINVKDTNPLRKKESLGKKEFKEVVNECASPVMLVRELVFIYREEITAPAKEFLQSHPLVMKGEMSFQVFHVDFFRTCILDYHLVPQLRILTEAEKQSLLSRLYIEETKLPKIWCNDKEVIYLNAKQGDVIRASRETLHGMYTTYRLVVEEIKEKKTHNKAKKKQT